MGNGESNFLRPPSRSCLPSLLLVATKRLYKSVCPSVGPSVRRSVGRSVRPYVTLLLFGLLGATNAVYTALFCYFL